MRAPIQIGRNGFSIRLKNRRATVMEDRNPNVDYSGFVVTFKHLTRESGLAVLTHFERGIQTIQLRLSQAVLREIAKTYPLYEAAKASLSNYSPTPDMKKVMEKECKKSMITLRLSEKEIKILQRALTNNFMDESPRIRRRILSLIQSQIKE